MPELPEVETIVRGLRAAVVGRRILGVRFGKTDFVAEPAVIAERLPGSRIASVERYGKIHFPGAGACCKRRCSLLFLHSSGHDRPDHTAHLGLAHRAGTRMSFSNSMTVASCAIRIFAASDR